MIRRGKIVWLDLGMVGVLSSRDRQIFRTAMLAITRQDIYELENAIMSLGILKAKINHNELYEDIRIFVDRYGSSDLQDLHLGKVLGEMMDIAAKHQIGMPNSITMLIRGVLTIEGVLEDCSPETSLMGILANHFSAGAFSVHSAEQELRHLLRKFAGSAEKVSDIPLNLADIIKMTVRGQTKINLELTGSEEPIGKADRMVDRLVFGIIDGALLIGSSMLCTTNMHPQILGIPPNWGGHAFLSPFSCPAYCCWTSSKNINRVRRREKAAAHFFCSRAGNENRKKEYIKMKQWKRFAWLPVLALAVGLLAGCGPNAAGNGSDSDGASVSEDGTDGAKLLSGKHHAEIEVQDYGTIVVELDADARSCHGDQFCQPGKRRIL